MRRFSIAAIVALSLWAPAGKAADFPNLVVVMMDDLADSTYDAAAALDYVPNIEALRARVSEPHLTNSTVLPSSGELFHRAVGTDKRSLE